MRYLLLVPVVAAALLGCGTDPQPATPLDAGVDGGGVADEAAAVRAVAADPRAVAVGSSLLQKKSRGLATQARIASTARVVSRLAVVPGLAVLTRSDPARRIT